MDVHSVPSAARVVEPTSRPDKVSYTVTAPVMSVVAPKLCGIPTNSAKAVHVTIALPSWRASSSGIPALIKAEVTLPASGPAPNARLSISVGALITAIGIASALPSAVTTGAVGSAVTLRNANEESVEVASTQRNSPCATQRREMLPPTCRRSANSHLGWVRTRRRALRS